jgi:hypothetical protein
VVLIGLIFARTAVANETNAAPAAQTGGAAR